MVGNVRHRQCDLICGRDEGQLQKFTEKIPISRFRQTVDPIDAESIDTKIRSKRKIRNKLNFDEKAKRSEARPTKTFSMVCWRNGERLSGRKMAFLMMSKTQTENAGFFCRRNRHTIEVCGAAFVAHWPYGMVIDGDDCCGFFAWSSIKLDSAAYRRHETPLFP